jgi:norsolorinic acid ketoreductase
LNDLPHGKDSKVILVKIDSAHENDAIEAVKVLKSECKITKLDVVIANAGISNYFGKATVTPAEEMLSHFKINTVAPLLLFQATVPLLNAAATPKFITISSGAGSISNMGNLPVANTAYGASKAAANFVTRKIHFENPNLIAFPIQPGWLQTDVSPTGF